MTFKTWHVLCLYVLIKGCMSVVHWSLKISSGAENKKQQKKRPRKHGGLSGTSSEESQSEDSDKESGKDCDSDDSFKSVSSADEDDDFNPFRDESDDDDEDGKTTKGGCKCWMKMFYSQFSAYRELHAFPSLDPWLIRKEPKKGKEKKKKKRRKSIDPDSIHSALLASGLGSTRPAFTSCVNPSSTPAPGKHVATWKSRNAALWFSRLGLMGDLFSLVHKSKQSLKIAS